MKKAFAPFILIVLAVCHQTGFAAGQRVLEGVFEPETIRVADDALYVVEGPSILVYSLKDLKLLRRIAGPGEGPGEFRPADFWYNTVTVLPEGIFVDGYDKTARFSKDGRLVGEERKPLGVSRMAPVGGNFAAVRPDHIEGEIQFQCLLLFDAKGTLIKELARQEAPVQAVTHRTEMIPDVLNFAVWEDRIYVEKSREGFVIDVFDSGGRFLYRIDQEHERTAVTEEHRNEAIEKFKTDPFVKRIGFEEFKRFSQFVWPKTLPAIMDLTVADGTIYARTSRSRGGKDRWLTMSLKGDMPAPVELPRADGAPLMAALNGVSYHAIHGRKFYFIRDNEKTGQWELFVEEIK